MYEVLEDDYVSDSEVQVQVGLQFFFLKLHIMLTTVKTEGAPLAKNCYVPTGSKEEVEDTMQIFAGSIGRIIGSQAKTLYEIQVNDLPFRQDCYPLNCLERELINTTLGCYSY